MQVRVHGNARGKGSAIAQGHQRERSNMTVALSSACAGSCAVALAWSAVTAIVGATLAELVQRMDCFRTVPLDGRRDDSGMP
jgi:hypothetical protein